MGFTEFEQELLEASASLAKVTFNKNICTVQWDFVAEYTSTIQVLMMKLSMKYYLTREYLEMLAEEM